MKLYVDVSERYPDYFWQTESYKWLTEIEAEPEAVERWEKSNLAYIEAQGEIEKLYEAAWKKESAERRKNPPKRIESAEVEAIAKKGAKKTMEAVNEATSKPSPYL